MLLRFQIFIYRFLIWFLKNSNWTITQPSKNLGFMTIIHIALHILFPVVQKGIIPKIWYLLFMNIKYIIMAIHLLLSRWSLLPITSIFNTHTWEQNQLICWYLKQRTIITRWYAKLFMFLRNNQLSPCISLNRIFMNSWHIPLHSRLKHINWFLMSQPTWCY